MERNRVSWLQEAHRLFGCMEEFDGGVSDELPAARSGGGVDAGLAAGDANATGGDVGARCREAGRVESRGEAFEIGEAGDEAKEGDGIAGGGVEIDDPLG